MKIRICLIIQYEVNSESIKFLGKTAKSDVYNICINSTYIYLYHIKLTFLTFQMEGFVVSVLVRHIFEVFLPEMEEVGVVPQPDQLVLDVRGGEVEGQGLV